MIIKASNRPKSPLQFQPIRPQSSLSLIRNQQISSKSPRFNQQLNLKQSFPQSIPQNLSPIPNPNPINTDRKENFTCKVQKINKIHEQISSLLQYVNQPAKSNVKISENDFYKKRNETSIEINALGEQISNKNVEESFIVGPTIDNKFEGVSKLDEICFGNKSYMQKLEGENRLSQIEKVSNTKSRNAYQYEYTYDKKSLNKNEQSKSQNKVKANQRCKTQFQKSYSKLKQSSEIYQIQTEILKKRNPDNLKPGKQINCDEELEKVRKRILDSSELTKKMQQKYLGSAERLNHYLNGKQEKPRPSRLITEARNSFLNVDKQNVSQTKKTERIAKQSNELNFKFKVIRCKSPIENNEQQKEKQDIKMVIAFKLVEQVKVEQKLRDFRQIFHNWRSEGKWKLLQSALNQLKCYSTLQSLEKQLAISANESNPFITEDCPSNIVELLAQSYVDCQARWKNQIVGSISKQNFFESGFNIKQIDISQRGYLSVEDLVCFVNMNTSNSFRNRDFISIYKRFLKMGSNPNGIEHEQFESVFYSK